METFSSPNDPDDWIDIDQSSWSSLNNGILEIHWLFYVKSNFPDQNNVRFVTGCTDNTGNNGFSPTPLASSSGLVVNNSFGLGWLMVRDNDGEVVSEDVEDGSWVAAGDTLNFQGAMWFADQQMHLKTTFRCQDSDEWLCGCRLERYIQVNGSFFISVEMPDIDVEEGLTYEIQTYNER